MSLNNLYDDWARGDADKELDTPAGRMAYEAMAFVFSWHNGEMLAKQTALATSQAENAKLKAVANELSGATIRLMETHGMHGPCKQHNCGNCKASYNNGLDVIGKFATYTLRAGEGK